MQFFQEFRFNFFTAGLQDLGAGTETARLTRSLTNTLPKLRSLQFVESSSESLTKIKVKKKKKNRDLRKFIITLSILCICFSRYASHRCPRWSARLSRSLESVWTVAMETAGAACNRSSKVWLPYISFALLDDFEKRTWHQERSRAEVSNLYYRLSVNTRGLLSGLLLGVLGTDRKIKIWGLTGS